MNSLIIIPTYNEAENIKPLINQIFQNKKDTHILIIDDSSPDKTGVLVQNLAKHDSRIKTIIREKKEGLFLAYKMAFKWAIKNNYKFICQMDSDLSHPPEVIPRLFEKIEHFDFVIASRYIKGGGTYKWTLTRKLISILGNIYARQILSSPIYDLTSGFTLWRQKVLKSIDMETIKSDGYAFQIELKHRALKKKFIFKEIPFTFKQRKKGKSKKNNSMLFEALWRTVLLRSYKTKGCTKQVMR